MKKGILCLPDFRVANWLPCRVQRSTSAWALLPQDLVVSVIKQLIADGDKAAAANLRRACKAWRTASKQYPAALICKELTKLRDMYNAFPQAASLQLSIATCTAEDLQPINACTQLTSIECKRVLQPERDAANYFKPDFTYLPDSLKSLTAENMTPYSSNQNLSNVTYLEYYATMPMPGSHRAVSSLLQSLPGLQVGYTSGHIYKHLILPMCYLQVVSKPACAAAYAEEKAILHCSRIQGNMYMHFESRS